MMNRQSLAPLANYALTGAQAMLIVYFIIAASIFLVKTGLTLAVPVSLDYGEGPLLDQALRLAAGDSLYPADLDAPPYTITNYPPLFVAVMAPFVGLLGSSFLPGRIISTLSALATAFFLARIVQHLTGSRFAGRATAVVFLAIPWVVQWTGLVRVDMLALALSTGALYLLVRDPDARRTRIVAALLLVGAIYTRQSYGLAAPLAALVWLWSRDRRAAREVAVVVAAVGGALFLLLTLLTGGGFWTHIVVANVNPFSWSSVGRWLGEIGATAPIAIVLALLFLALGRSRLPGWPLLATYLLGATISALTIGKNGSNVNYLLELAAALVLAAGVWLGYSEDFPWRRVGLLVALALQTGLFIEATLNRPVADLTFRRGVADDLADLREIVASAGGPVLADEYMSLVPLAGERLYLQPFEMTQLAGAGEWDQEALITAIENKEFPLILVWLNPYDAYPIHQDRWTSEMLAAIDEHYNQSTQLAGNIVYMPVGSSGVGLIGAPDQAPTFASAARPGTPVVVANEFSIQTPIIAVNPALSDHLAVAYTTYAESDCNDLSCRLAQRLFISTDGGATWNDRDVFSAGAGSAMAGDLAFDEAGVLYALVLRDGRPLLNRATGPGYDFAPAAAQMLNTVSFPLSPDLVSVPDETLYLVYAGRSRANLSVRLNRSDNGGQTWSPSVGAEDGVPLSAVEELRAIPQVSPHLLVGPDESVAMLWVWDAGYWRWPLRVWLAQSEDGGLTFGEPRRLVDTWSIVSATAADGRYYFLYQTGSETARQLALAVSEDGGTTWRASVVSGDLVLGGDFSVTPGLAVAPDGTIDIAFFAPAERSQCTRDRDAWLAATVEGSFDDCARDLYYTYSEDDGRTFATPLKLTTRGIRDAATPAIEAQAAVAATDEAAYVLWNDTSLLDLGPMPTVLRIER